MKIKVSYFFDALCGWCYGFSPAFMEMFEEHKNDIEFEAFCGGMVINDRIGPIGKVAAYIKDAYKVVEEKSGEYFGEDFLNNILEPGTAVFTSIPSAQAMAVVKSEHPELSVPYAAELLKGVYLHGYEPLDHSKYGEMAASVGAKIEDFESKMKSEVMLGRAYEDFKTSHAFGVKGFPTLIATMDEKHYVLSNGFIPYPELKQRFQTLYAYSKEK